MAANPTTAARGLLDSLGNLAASLVAVAQTRLELLSNDLGEGREHLLTLIVLGLAALLSLGVGLVLAVGTLVLVFWDSYRLLALSGFAIVFLIAGGLGWLQVLRRARAAPRIFNASLSELAKDRQQLMPRP